MLLRIFCIIVSRITIGYWLPKLLQVNFDLFVFLFQLLHIVLHYVIIPPSLSI